MLSGRYNLPLIVILTIILLYPVAVAAGVLVYCLDTAGSMKAHNKFEAAKAVLIRQIEETH